MDITEITEVVEIRVIYEDRGNSGGVGVMAVTGLE